MDLLECVGLRLKTLKLNHVDQFGKRALALITVTCPNLVTLGLHNCEFTNEMAADLHDQAFDLADRFFRQLEVNSIIQLASPMLELKVQQVPMI